MILRRGSGKVGCGCAKEMQKGGGIGLMRKMPMMDKNQMGTRVYVKRKLKARKKKVSGKSTMQK